MTNLLTNYYTNTNGVCVSIEREVDKSDADHTRIEYIVCVNGKELASYASREGARAFADTLK